jgi:molybdenum storage protein
MMEHAKNRRSIRVINGLTQGNLTRALAGEDVGTLIYAD